VAARSVIDEVDFADISDADSRVVDVADAAAAVSGTLDARAGSRVKGNKARRQSHAQAEMITRYIIMWRV